MELVNSLLRALQILWTLLITALIGNVIASNVNAASSATSAVNFTMFVAVLAWIASLYGLVGSFVADLGVPLVMLILDGLSVLFTFVAAVVLSAKLTAVNCAHLAGKSRSYIAYGSLNDTKRCREIQASAAFLWFLFGCFLATLFFAFKAFKGLGGGARSNPNMAQVAV